MAIKLPKEPARASLAEPRVDGYRLPTTIDPASLPRPHANVPDWHFENVSTDVPVSVARVALNKEQDILSRKVAAKAKPAANPMQFQMSGNPYAPDMARQFDLMTEASHAEAERLKDHLRELEALTADADIVRWAVDNGKVARHVSGGWAII